MYMAPKKVQPEPEPEIEEEEEFDEEEEEEEDYEDMGGVLASFLTTDEGDNVCTALVTIGNHMDRMSKLMDTQNKILLKMLAHMTKQQT